MKSLNISIRSVWQHDVRCLRLLTETEAEGNDFSRREKQTQQR